MKDSISLRIRKISIEMFKGNNSEFARSVGIGESSVRSYLSGTLPKADVLEKILNKTAISCEWLLTGHGEMLKPKQKYKEEPTPMLGVAEPMESHGIAPVARSPSSAPGIPLIPISAMAGYASGDTQVMEYELGDDLYNIPEFTNKGVKFLIRTSGSSMYPKYNNGDILACRPVNDLTFFQWGKVYVLDTEQGAIIKRLFESPDKDYLECHSDNKDNYPPFTIPKLSIRKVAIVIGVVRLE